MSRVKIGPAAPDPQSLKIEITRVRNLDLDSLRARWAAVMGRQAPSHLPQHLLFRTLAYRLQCDALGGLDTACRRLLDQSASPEQAGRLAIDRQLRTPELRPGTVLAREWNGRMERVMVLPDGFAWNGMKYPSVSKVASAITGTHWNGPKFFGLRNKPKKAAPS